MKKTKYIHVALVTAALASCKPTSFTSRSCPLPIIPEDRADSHDRDSCACLESEQAYFDALQAFSGNFYFPYPDRIFPTFFGPTVYQFPGYVRANFIVRGGFGASLAKVSS